MSEVKEGGLSKRNRNILIGVAAVVVVAVAGGLGGYFGTRKTGTSNDSTNSGGSSGGSTNKGDWKFPLVKNQLVGYFGQNAI
ncbi:hypothetical protein HDU99_009890, partial [Rhizoclosmatium hyalinum]